MCYDLVTKRNPISELGGLSTMRMGYGSPGTGKSLQIAATATMLDDMCKWLGIPFLFWPMPDTIISIFQGSSGERAAKWFQPMSDPGKIIYAPIDDGENNFEDRSRQGVSSGVREVIGVFLRHTEGAYAINHGNSVIEIFTNLPDQIDKAVLSRIVDRFSIDGAQLWQDFLDQDYLWWKKYKEIDPGFIKMTDPVNYNYLSSQALIQSLSETYGSVTEPNNSDLRQIFSQTRDNHDLNHQLFFVELFKSIKEFYPFVTSRDIRNIQRAVDGRIYDFDFPDDWMKDPEVFFKQNYDRKKVMIMELVKTNMRGLSFAELRLQEAIRYLDNLVKINETGKERKISELVENLELQTEAHNRMKKD